MSLLDKLHIVYQTKRNKLAIRCLIDKARQFMWNTTFESLSDAQKKEVVEWITKNRLFGQNETSWRLRTQALDTLYSDWKDKLNVDPDMFAIVNSDEHNHRLFDSASQILMHDVLKAISCIDVADLRGFYRKVLDYVLSRDINVF
jgi:hypothetical protein